jgi:hypothetical protein
MSKTNRLARHYGNLTPDERFRLIVAAGARGDKLEQDRLVRAGQRITLSVQDHAPYAHALNELALLVYLELLEDAAHYLDLFACTRDARNVVDTEEVDADEEEQAETSNADEKESEAKTAADAAEDVVEELSPWERSLDLALAAGFVLRTKTEGWKLFCQRLTIPPWVFWKGLPGFDRLRHALKVCKRVAFSPEGFLRWLNRVRPAGEPEQSQVRLTVEGWAAAAEAMFRERIAWWGG